MSECIHVLLRSYALSLPMDIFLVYLLDRFIYRIAHFLRHWYVDSPAQYGRFVMAYLERMDRVIALKVTWRNLLQPLYQERDVFGYVLGFLFRAIRLIIGGIFYGVVIALAAIVFFAWAAVPPYILLRIAGETPAVFLYMKHS